MLPYHLRMPALLSLLALLSLNAAACSHVTRGTDAVKGLVRAPNFQAIGTGVTSKIKSSFEPSDPLSVEEIHLRDASKAFVKAHDFEVSYLRKATFNVLQGNKYRSDPVSNSESAYYKLRSMKKYASDDARTNVLLDDLRRTNVHVHEYSNVAISVLAIDVERVANINRNYESKKGSEQNASILIRTMDNRKLIIKTMDMMDIYYRAYEYAEEQEKLNKPGDLIHIDIAQELAFLHDSTQHLRDETLQLDQLLLAFIENTRTAQDQLEENEIEIPESTSEPEVVAQPTEPVVIVPLTN